VGIWVQMSGGIGPDGMAMDAEGRVAVAHPGMGAVWIFSRTGEPVSRIRACEGMRVTNVAYGGPDRKTLFMTEADSGAVLAADLDVPGHPMYSHLD
jgi:gluconolactonase